jgi:hypothetical protein
MYHKISIVIVRQNLMSDRKDLEFRNVNRNLAMEIAKNLEL